MTTYFLDANILLRFILKDEISYFEKSKKYLQQAQKGEIAVTLLSEIFLEIEYVLRKVYKKDKAILTEVLVYLSNLSYIQMPDRAIISQALAIYCTQSIDLVDCILHFKAQAEGAQVLTFDKDFKKIT